MSIFGLAPEYLWFWIVVAVIVLGALAAAVTPVIVLLYAILKALENLMEVLNARGTIFRK